MVAPPITIGSSPEKGGNALGILAPKQHGQTPDQYASTDGDYNKVDGGWLSERTNGETFKHDSGQCGDQHRHGIAAKRGSLSVPRKTG